MKEFSTQEDFIKEAARRAGSNYAEGYVVINDLNEGAIFSGKVSYDDNYNKGNYQGIKSLAMKLGDEFAVILVPNGTVQQVWQNPSVNGDLRPLFSLVRRILTMSFRYRNGLLFRDSNAESQILVSKTTMYCITFHALCHRSKIRVLLQTSHPSCSLALGQLV